MNEAILDDPEVDAILAARGGFGCTRILPKIDQEAIRQANKTIIGFSDITALAFTLGKGRGSVDSRADGGVARESFPGDPRSLDCFGGVPGGTVVLWVSRRVSEIA